jgi:hypothetical protein
MTLGYYDSDKFVGDLEWHDVKNRWYFGLKLDDIKINGLPLNVCERVTNP